MSVSQKMIKEEVYTCRSQVCYFKKCKLSGYR